MKSIVVAGTHSGVGKTCVAIGLMAAFRRRGLRVQPFKVGPDFLDPMHHKAAAGQESFNLDGWMLSREVNLQCFLRNAEYADLAIVEGVMGLFDGRDGKSEVGSTAEMAKMLGAPVVLVLDAYAMSRSAAAMVHGYTSFDPDLHFAGVIFNKVGGAAHLAWLREALNSPKVTAAVLGGLPKTADLEVPERHLGLQMPGEEGIPVGLIEKLADLVEQHIDLDVIFERAGEVVQPPVEEAKGEGEGDGDGDGDGEAGDDLGVGLQAHLTGPLPKFVRIGVARDEAFCFYYHENLALLQDAGAELVYFSPLHDTLPARLDAIYLGGGYPELHAKQLAENTRMLYAMRAFAAAGGIIYGECGGLMYLAQSVETPDGERHAMCAVLPFRTRMVQQMKMGYVMVSGSEGNSIFPPEVGEIRGQVFHFSEVVMEEGGLLPKPAFQMQMQFPDAVPEPGGFLQGAVLASYVHLHLGSNPAAAHALVERCKENTSKAAAVAAASASAVADSGPVAAAAAGAAAAAAVAEALAEPRSNIPSDEDDGTDLVRALSASSMFMHTPRRDFRRRSESARWESRARPGAVPDVPAAAPNSPWDWSYQEAGRSPHPEVLESHSEEKPTSTLRPMRRSMSEYWGSLQTRRRGKRTSTIGRVDSPDGRSVASATWGSPDSKTSSDEEVHRMGGERRIRDLANGHGTRSLTPESEMVYSTPRREFSSPAQSSGENGVSFRIGDSGGSKEDLRIRNGEKHGRALSDDMDTPSSSDGGETWESHNRGRGAPSSPDEWGGSGSRARAQLDARVGPSPSRNVGNRLSASPPSGQRLNGGYLERASGPFSNGRVSSMTSLDRPPVPTRILSLLPSATEILVELGVGDRLVGISDLCDYPLGASKGRHVVSRSKIDAGSMSSRSVEEAMRRFQERRESVFELDVPWLRRVQPDLIFTQDTCSRCDVDKSEVARALAKADLLDNPDTAVVVLRPRTMSEVLESIVTIGESVGLAPQAHFLVEQLRMRLRHVARTVAGEPRLRVLSLEGLWPPVMGGHWLPEMKMVAGGVDGLLEAGARAERPVWEKVTAYAPDVLLLAPCSSSPQRTLSEVKYVASLPGFWSLPAVQHCRVYVCDHCYFSRPGPRLVDGVEILARLLHPSRIRTRLPPGMLVMKLTLEPGQRCRPEDIHKHFHLYQ